MHEISLVCFKTPYNVQISLSRQHIMLLSTINILATMTGAWEYNYKGVGHKTLVMDREVVVRGACVQTMALKEGI